MSHVTSKMLSCRMSNLRNALCRATIFSGGVVKPYVAYRFKEMAVSPCRIKGSKTRVFGGFLYEMLVWLEIG